MHTILIADDNPQINEILQKYLLNEGYTVVIAQDGQQALDLFYSHAPSLVLLDVMMPRLDGLQVCAEIRKISDVPIMMLTAKGEDADRISGLDTGADDYVVKPFSTGELMARIRAILRRTSEQTTRRSIAIANLLIQPELGLVKIDDKQILLTRKELDLLWILASNPGRIFTRDNLLSIVWGFNTESTDRTVDTHIKRLRAKLDEHDHSDWQIKTVWGVGYQFEVSTS